MPESGLRRRRPTLHSYASTAAALALALAVAACGEPVGVDGDLLVLTSVDGALPAPLPGWPGVEVTGGTLDVRGDDTVEQRLDLRCSEGSGGCTVPEHWRRMEGVLDRTEVTAAGAMRIDWSDGREALLTMSGDTATVSHPLPPSGGFGSVTFRFEP